MKKIIITLTLCVLVFSSIAQEDSLAKWTGHKNLPKAGDIAVGFEARPILNYIGNMFNGTQNNSLNLSDNTLYFRYYLSNDAAIRAAVRINSNGSEDQYYVQDDAAVLLDPLSQKQVKDQYTYSQKQFEIKLGYQMFHNRNRLRAYYGADLIYFYSKEKENYEYGNQMNELNPAPTSHWGNLGTRDLEIIDGTINGIGVGALGGFEYYFLPKICLGVEFGIKYMGYWKGQSYSTQERMVLTTHVEEEIPSSPGYSNWSLTTDFPYYYGNLFLTFHF